MMRPWHLSRGRARSLGLLPFERKRTAMPCRLDRSHAFAPINMGEGWPILSLLRSLQRRNLFVGRTKMLASRRSGQPAGSGVSLRDTLICGWTGCRACRSTRSHAAQGYCRSIRGDRSASRTCRATKSCSSAPGLISKFKVDSSGRRQIVALRFPGEGILPREGVAGYGIQAIVRSEVMVGSAKDLDKIIDATSRASRGSSGG